MPSPRRARSAAPTVRPDPRILSHAAELAEQGIAFVCVTVLAASGSAPGKPGAKMIVTEEATLGQVGGGRVEAAAIRKARSLLGSRGGPEQEVVHVVKDLGMSCGGSMTLLYEAMSPPVRLVVFGAGHVSRALCAVAATVGFDVTVLDEREEWLVEGAFPETVTCIRVPWSEAVDRAAIDDRTLVTSVSPGHAVDQVVIRAIHEKKLRPQYLGVIGSVRKGIVFKEELIADGLPEPWVRSIRIPMGVPLGGVEPGEIAISIVADLISSVRGVPLQPWYTPEKGAPS